MMIMMMVKTTVLGEMFIYVILITMMEKDALVSGQMACGRSTKILS